MKFLYLDIWLLSVIRAKFAHPMKAGGDIGQIIHDKNRHVLVLCVSLQRIIGSTDFRTQVTQATLKKF